MQKKITWDIWLDIKDTTRKCEKTVYNTLKRNGFYDKPKEKKKCRRYQYKSKNELWHIDITEFRIKGFGKFYIIAIIDDYSRYIVGFGIFKRKTVENILEVFSKAVERYGRPIAILSDNGKQFLSRIYKKHCADNGIKIRKTWPYNPKCNGKIERWFKDLKIPEQFDTYCSLSKKCIQIYSFVQHFRRNFINFWRFFKKI